MLIFISKHVALTVSWSPNCFKSALKTSSMYIMRLLHYSCLKEHPPPQFLKIYGRVFASRLHKLIQEGWDLGRIFSHGYSRPTLPGCRLTTLQGGPLLVKLLRVRIPTCRILYSGSAPPHHSRYRD